MADSEFPWELEAQNCRQTPLDCGRGGGGRMTSSAQAAFLIHSASSQIHSKSSEEDLGTRFEAGCWLPKCQMTPLDPHLGEPFYG